MMRATFLLIALLAQPVLSAQDKPNIVFILADDMSFDSVSANNDKIGNMKTPHLDKLISQGMNFTDAHSGSSVCTPTRYGLLTGRYCWRTKLKSKVLWDWGAPLVEKERLTVADMLQAQGYSTGMVGKWHLGLDWYDSDGKIANGDLEITDSSYLKGAPAERVRAVQQRIDFTKGITGGPTDHGFDYYFGVDVPNFPPYIWIENDKLQGEPSMDKPKRMFGNPGPMIPGWKLDEILPGLARRAGEWITEQSTTDQPFFLYLPLTSPHTPVAPSKEFKGKSGINGYADFVIETDWVVGHIMAELERAGVADNTLLIFSTDNGTAGSANLKKLKSLGVDLNNHFKGRKLEIHEGGHRVPFAARWPGKIKPGSTCSQTICLNDFMATAADMLDFELPDDAAEDSTSILPLLLGEKRSLPNRPWVVNHDFKGGFAIRKGMWKLVDDSKLYDLDDDPKEAKDVARQYPEVVMELSATLKRYKERGRSRAVTQ
jgi:arylsulfatase A